MIGKCFTCKAIIINPMDGSLTQCYGCNTKEKALLNLQILLNKPKIDKLEKEIIGVAG